MASATGKDDSIHNDERVVVACDVIQQMKILEESTTYNRQKQLQQQHQGGRSSSSTRSSSDLVTLEPSTESPEKIRVERSTLLKSFRPIIVSWMYNLSKTFQLNHSVVPTAAYYIDRVVSHSIMMQESNNNKDDDGDGAGIILIKSTQEYQLISLTCLHIAMKLYESKLFPMDQLLKLGGTENNFTAQQIEQMELTIVGKILKWNLHPPTCHCYFQQYMIILRTIVRNEDVVVLDEIEKESHRFIQILEIERDDGYNFGTCGEDGDDANDKQKQTRYIPPSVLCFATMLLVLERFVEEYQMLSWERHFVPFVKQIQRITQITDKYMDGILLHALMLVDDKKNSKSKNQEKRDDDDTVRKERDVNDDDVSTDSTASTVSSTSRTHSSTRSSISNSNNGDDDNDKSTSSIDSF